MAAFLGILVLCFSSLTYEDEEGRIQNKLEDLWIMLDEKRTASLSWTGTFIKAVVTLAGKAVDRVFGRRLFSPRSVAVSAVLSVASIGFTASILTLLSFRPLAKLYNPTNSLHSFIFFLRVGAFGLVPALSESPSLPWKPWFPKIMRTIWWISIISAIFGITDFLVFVYLHSPEGHKWGPLFASSLFLIFALSIFCDVSYIAFLRWMLRRISKSERAGELLLAIALLFLALVTIVVVPVYLGFRLAPFAGPIAFAIGFSFAVNSLDVLAILAVLALATFLLLHRLMWPILQRPLYAVQRVAITGRKGWLWSVGVLFVTYGLMGIPEWLKALLSRLGL
ncbi:MAG: hypothetical protein ABR987_03675 [Terracidiphilus sp.]